MANSRRSNKSRLRTNLNQVVSVAYFINPFTDADARQATQNAARAIRDSRQLERIDAILAENPKVVDFARQQPAQPLQA